MSRVRQLHIIYVLIIKRKRAVRILFARKRGIVCKKERYCL